MHCVSLAMTAAVSAHTAVKCDSLLSKQFCGIHQGITDSKIHVGDSATDFKQLVRQIGELNVRLPSWRQQRPSLTAEAAEYHLTEGQQHGTLLLRQGSSLPDNPELRHIGAVPAAQHWPAELHLGHQTAALMKHNVCPVLAGSSVSHCGSL